MNTRPTRPGEVDPLAGGLASPSTPDRFHATQPSWLRHAPHALIALALIVGVALYDSLMIYLGQPLWCPPPIDGCNQVAASPYARILDLPVGYFGVVYYVGMLVLAALLARDPGARALRLAAALYAGMGVLFSLYFAVLQLAYIRAFCIYCLISAVTTVLLTAIATANLRGWHGFLRAG